MTLSFLIMKQKTKYLLISLFFALVQIMVILRNYFLGYFVLYWYCDFAPTIFAILFFFKANQAVKGYLNIGLIPQLIFLFGFFYKLVFDISLLGDVTNSLSTGLFYTLSTTISHLSTLLALILVIKTKPSKKSLLYSFIFLMLIYAITILFTSPQEYINYVYSSGNLVSFRIPYLTLIWIPLAFVFLVIPTYFLQHLLYWLAKNKK